MSGFREIPKHRVLFSKVELTVEFPEADLLKRKRVMFLWRSLVARPRPYLVPLEIKPSLLHNIVLLKGSTW